MKPQLKLNNYLTELDLEWSFKKMINNSWLEKLVLNNIFAFTIPTLTCQIIVQQILLFLGEKNTYTTLLGPTRLLISEIFPPKPDFHLHKWEKNRPTQPY